MNSYAIYRIAARLLMLLFMNPAILVFNFYRVAAAVMIEMLSLLKRRRRLVDRLRQRPLQAKMSSSSAEPKAQIPPLSVAA
jgi:hypothetical protein